MQVALSRFKDPASLDPACSSSPFKTVTATCTAVVWDRKHVFDYVTQTQTSLEEWKVILEG